MLSFWWMWMKFGGIVVVGKIPLHIFLNCKNVIEIEFHCIVMLSCVLPFGHFWPKIYTNTFLTFSPNLTFEMFLLITNWQDRRGGGVLQFQKILLVLQKISLASTNIPAPLNELLCDLLADFGLGKHSRALLQGRTDFSNYLNRRIGMTFRRTRKKITSSERGRKGLSEDAIFFKKYAFLPGVKNRRKRVKIWDFRYRYIF